MQALRRYIPRAAAVAAAAALLALAGCDRNSANLPLRPSGRIPTPPVASTGVLTGTLDFGNPGDHPASLVMIAPVLDPTCASQFSTIQVVGTFTSFNIGSSPRLTNLSPCFWVDTLSLPVGALGWKFITDGAFDTPPDYGKLGSQTDGLVGIADLDAPGPDGDMKATVAAAGTYLCQLDETFATGKAYYSFVPIASCTLATFSSAVDGRFQLSRLRPGPYNVLVRTPGNIKDTLIANLNIGSGNTDVGTLNLGGPIATGGLTGTVTYDAAFPDITGPPFPPTSVTVKQGTTTVASTTAGGATNSFTLVGLNPGTYDVVFDANVFQSNTRAGIVVGPGAPTDLGATALAKNNAEVSNTLNLAGDFNSFAIDIAWEMQQSPLGVWTLDAPAPIPAGTQFMKFVTDGAFDTPPDWGGDESVTVDLPAANVATRRVSGSSTAIKTNFAAAGNYRFILDERRQVFTVQSPGGGAIAVPVWRRR